MLRVFSQAPKMPRAPDEGQLLATPPQPEEPRRSCPSPQRTATAQAGALLLVAVIASCAWYFTAHDHSHHGPPILPSSSTTPPVPTLAARPRWTVDYSEWLQEHSPAFLHSQQGHKREGIFLSNLHVIAEHNRNFSLGLTGYKLAAGVFADMTPQEFAENILTRLPPIDDRAFIKFGQPLRLPTDIVGAVPTDKDWRASSGVVSPVKQQGSCGSCWSFSAAGAIEGAHAIAGNPTVNVSEQQLMDCRNDGGKNCDGGWYYKAFQYVLENGGVDSDEDYPYIGVKEGRCTGHSECDAQEYCDASGRCFDCSYITSWNCDAIDDKCCGDEFRAQCPSDPRRCDGEPLPAFIVVGSPGATTDGIYTQTNATCNRKPVYQAEGSYDGTHGGDVLYQPSGYPYWKIGSSGELTDCSHQTGTTWLRTG